MTHFMKKITLIALLAVVMPAQAAIQSLQFAGQVESGYYNGTSYQGQFSFDDAGLLASGTELLNLSSLNFNFGGSLFNLGTPALADATAVFQDGVFTGLEWSVDSSSPAIGFSLIAGYADTSDAFFAYDTTLGFSGTGSLAYAAAVPEPTQSGLIFAGLGLIGLIATRRKS
ncbi:PEP-CTERM sorting domain-containing protein [Methylophilus medardicus]|uniref:PEP-CTERM sorting domain-containing protein n=2 Tax=Methylophilus medardicus TaxID=2588534 RepID=A0A5B8CTQ7_9PROT|nr:PEP-CTERM sorting domain-containing protein [Methylophilus medardicus]QDC49688.1 PEP-CTERM sorting domain-containing protein [Methylophilus medardicus]QDC53393.1 PEP-CTERM sorting domain-containing protein [Methylophilus medardicus]